MGGPRCLRRALLEIVEQWPNLYLESGACPTSKACLHFTAPRTLYRPRLLCTLVRMSRLYFGIPADPGLHSFSYCPSHANSLQPPRLTTAARLCHIGQAKGLYAESAVDGSRTSRPSVAQQSPLPSFESRDSNPRNKRHIHWSLI
jgi:hypothetical protein